jgi:hemin uptake protein HemP
MVGRCVVGLALLGLFGAGCAPAAKREPPLEESISSQSTVPPALKANLSTILREGTELELVSLHQGFLKCATGLEHFREFWQLDSTKVTDEKVREELVSALERAATDPTIASKCFEPRHAIRVNHEGATYDLAISFECEKVRAYKGKDLISEFLVGNRHQPPFDKVLTEARVKVAEKPK